MTNFEGMGHLILLQEGYQNSYVYTHRIVAWQTEIRARESADLEPKTAGGSSAESRSTWRAFTISQRITNSIYGPIINKELHNFSHVPHIAHIGRERHRFQF